MILLLVGVVVAKKTVLRPAPIVRGALGSSSGFSDSYPLYAPLKSTEVSEVWSEVMPGNTQGAAIDGDRLYALYDHNDVSGLAALDLTNGQKLWTKELSSRFTGDLLVDGGQLLLVGAVKDKPTATPTATVAAWRTSDGERAWGPTDVEGTGAKAVTPVTDGQVVVSSPRKDGKGSIIQAIDLGNGAKRWTKEGSGPAVAAGPTNVYLRDGDDIVAYRTGSGEKAFSINAAGLVRAVEIGGLVAVARADDVGRVQAYDVGNGKKQWDKEVRNDAIDNLGRLDDASLLVSTTNHFTVVDAGSGKELWTSTSLSSPFFISTVPGRLFGTSDGKIIELSLDKGTEVANVRVKGDASSVLPADGFAYLYDAGSSQVVGYDLTVGERMWSWAVSKKGSDVGVLPVDRGALVFDGDRLSRLG